MHPRGMWNSYWSVSKRFNNQENKNRQDEAKRYIELSIDLIEGECFDILFINCPYNLKIPVFKILMESEILSIYYDIDGNTIIKSCNGTEINYSLIYGI